MPEPDRLERWVRHSDAAADERRRADRDRPMAENLEETVRLSRVLAELESNLRAPERGVRA